MKRTWYVFMAAAVLTVTFVGGCGKRDTSKGKRGTDAPEIVSSA